MAQKEELEKDWNLIRRLLGIYTPELFDLDKCSYELYLRCSTMIQTRCFGWGLPGTLVAPIADSFNHHPKSENEIDIVNKKLHQQAIFAKDDTIQKYLHNFDWKSYDDDPLVKKLDTKKSKLRYDISRLIPGSGFLKI